MLEMLSRRKPNERPSDVHRATSASGVETSPRASRFQNSERTMPPVQKSAGLMLCTVPSARDNPRQHSRRVHMYTLFPSEKKNYFHRRLPRIYKRERRI